MSQGATSRNFRLGLGVRSFQAGRRLPYNLASVFVQVKLPAGLTGSTAQNTVSTAFSMLRTACRSTSDVSCCVDIIKEAGISIPQDADPFSTQPAVDVARGSDVSLPGGQISLQFSAGLMKLAALLAREPRLTAEVWHKPK